MKCPVCSNSFDAADRKPLVGLCGHTICGKCKDAMTSWKCPVSRRCHQAGDVFIVAQPHFKIIEIIETYGKRKNEVEPVRQEFSDAQKSKEHASLEVQEAGEKLRVLGAEVRQMETLSSASSEKDLDICPGCNRSVEKERLLTCQECYERGIHEKICCLCIIENHAYHEEDISIVTLSSDDGFEGSDDSVMIVDDGQPVWTTLKDSFEEMNMSDCGFQKRNLPGDDDIIMLND